MKAPGDTASPPSLHRRVIVPAGPSGKSGGRKARKVTFLPHVPGALAKNGYRFSGMKRHHNKSKTLAFWSNGLHHGDDRRRVSPGTTGMAAVVGVLIHVRLPRLSFTNSVHHCDRFHSSIFRKLLRLRLARKNHNIFLDILKSSVALPISRNEVWEDCIKSGPNTAAIAKNFHVRDTGEGMACAST
ncbi:hypothetical protein [Rhizomicrobium electricum]|jgi:hypothetical protein|uniref:hypothetical protein n=1 Tax=Rhizomicrobium electricum TaxID=480070 RepID=UPI00141FF263|nr:hypothetical protein [Rhizomicrobium electricum]NIJ47192.1 hypothetical protein [Rhizomicrobium electricum]